MSSKRIGETISILEGFRLLFGNGNTVGNLEAEVESIRAQENKKWIESLKEMMKPKDIIPKKSEKKLQQYILKQEKESIEKSSIEEINENKKEKGKGDKEENTRI